MCSGWAGTEAEENVSIMRLMLAHYRAVFRDAQSHGFEAARWSSGVILTMLERGEVTWDNTLKMAEERRTALISPVVPVKDYFSSANNRDQRPQRQGQSQGQNYNARSGSINSNGNRGGSSRKTVKACVFHNNGSCPHDSHHENANTRWRHVCKDCWDQSHVS
jgi:hypothetical protein